MATGDAAYIKKINRSLILEKIIDKGHISRADLSKLTNLTRATISAQVADLLDEDLLIETEPEHLTVGRKPILLSLNGEAGYALGIDLDFGHVTFALTNLLGIPVSINTIEFDTIDYEEILQLIISEIKKYQSNFSDRKYGIVGAVIGIHGLVSLDEKIHFVPRYKWDEIEIKGKLENEIGIPIIIENNANLSSFAERAYVHHKTNHLLSITLYSGIGIGIMINNEFFRGQDGFAGEAGHIIMVPNGKPCNCGNQGCWEQYASELSFYEEIAAMKELKQVNIEQMKNWINEKDELVLEQMEQFIYYFSIGVNNLINLYNPDVIVIDSELIRLYPDAIDKIKSRLHSSISHYRQLTVSALGNKSCVFGACALAIKQFLDVPCLNFNLSTTNN